MFYNKIGVFTLIKRETNRYMKVYVQALLAPLFSNLLFLGVFGAALNNRAVGIEGVDYLSFMVPGLCMMGAIMSSFTNSSSSLIIQKYNGSIQDINSYPLTAIEKVFAYVLSGTIRGVVVGVATFLASIPFVGFTMAHPFLFFIALFLSSTFFSSLGLVVGLHAKDFEYISFMVTFIITPLTYFGGVFFEITSLPNVLQKISFLNPVVPMVQVIRYGYLGLTESNINISIIMMTLTVMILVYMSYLMMKKGIGLVVE